jgi:hydroxymethylbilane synthase
MSDVLRVGTRGSPLALAQTEEVLARLRAVHPRVSTEVVVIKTHGDEGYRSDWGTTLDGKQAFTKRIDEALLARRIDFAVHSLKDLPVERADGVALGAIPPRADPRDVLVARDGWSLARLSPGTRVGTSSLRRRAQLLARWPGLKIVDLHGNVGTRLQRLDGDDLDAIVVASAGIQRLAVTTRIEPIDPEVVVPAPGQGALAVQTREDNEPVRRMLASIDDATSRIATEAERSLAGLLGGGCDVPMGALATIHPEGIHLNAVVASPDGHRLVRASVRGSVENSGAVVEEAYQKLLKGGGREILEEVAR